MSEAWAAFVGDATHGLQQKDAAAATGFNQSVISRWLDPQSDSQPRADRVIDFARATNTDPVAALVAAGYLQKSDTDTIVEVSRKPGELSTAQLEVELRTLFHETLRRAKRAEKRKRGTRVNPDAPPV